MNVTIPTTDDIRIAVRAELADFFASFQFNQLTETDDIGRGAEFAAKITGKAPPTIYDLVHKRLIPHSKKGKDLYFSRAELLKWIADGKRKTQSEIALDAENFSTNPKQSNQKVTA